MKVSKRYLIKSLSWRILGTLDTLIIAYFVTGNLKLGIQISIFDLIFKLILYYYHELLWDKYIKILKINLKHILKTFSWRLFAIITTFIISFFITGSASAGLKIGLIETITKMLLYYFHEKVWFKIKY
mgnify:CR=1 FL=1